MKKREEKRLTEFLFLACKFVTVSDSPRLVNLTIRLVNSVLKLQRASKVSRGIQITEEL